MPIAIVVVAAIASIVGGAMGGAIVTRDAQVITGAVQALILLVTAWIVWKYTGAAQMSNEIQERPILNLYLREEKVGSNIRRWFQIRNIGRGPAYNIRIQPIACPDGHQYEFDLDEPNAILESGGDEKTISPLVRKPKNGVEMHDDSLFLMFSRCFPEKRGDEQKRIGIVFALQYEGVDGHRRHSLFRVYPKHIFLTPDTIYPIVEFISNGEGTLEREQALRVCEQHPIAR